MFADARATAERIVWMVGCWELRVLFPRDHQTLHLHDGFRYKSPLISPLCLCLPESGDGTM
jgi:hypothetical protein